MAQIDWSRMVTADMKTKQARKEATARLDYAVQDHLDKEARGHGYQDSSTLASYSGSAIPKWRAEAMAFIAWRDNVWLSVQKAAEGRITHDPEALIAELPPMTWPS
jgi:hypothetical protein